MSRLTLPGGRGPSRRRSGPDLTADWLVGGRRKTIGCWSSWRCATRGNCRELHTERRRHYRGLDLMLWKDQKVKGQLPTRRAEAAVHVGPVPGLHGAVHRRQGAERPLAWQRRHRDEGVVHPVLVLVDKPRPRAEARTNQTRLRARRWKHKGRKMTSCQEENNICISRQSSVCVCRCVCVCVGVCVPSPCFLIFRVTVSPACCSRLMASLRGFPFRLLLLMARIRSPTWIAPVLHTHTHTHNTHTHNTHTTHTQYILHHFNWTFICSIFFFPFNFLFYTKTLKPGSDPGIRPGHLIKV